jgi:hypothetical protein
MNCATFADQTAAAKTNFALFIAKPAFAALKSQRSGNRYVLRLKPALRGDCQRGRR